MRQDLRPLSILFAILAMVAAIDRPAIAYTNREIDTVFRMLDTNHDEKVSRAEYDVNKVRAIYRNPRHDPMVGLTFEETYVSRKFFASADVDHDGKLSPVELLDALPFETVDTGKRGYFVLEDLRRFLKSIGR